MSSDQREPGIDTQVIHGGQRPEPVTGAMVPPLFLAATYVQDSPGRHRGFEYSRSHNPTRYAVERMAAVLEGSQLTEEEDPSRGGFAFASGMAAMSTVLELLDAGSRVVAMDDLYGGSRRLLTQVLERSQGLDVTYADLSDLDAFSAAMTPETRMVWLETPTNPLMKLADLGAVATLARRRSSEVLLVCDNTFASPVSQRPLEHGFDVVVHSSTKYLNGHSDSVGGLAVARDPGLAERLRFLQNAAGAVMSPFDAYLTLRGIKTLALRIRRHDENGLRIATFLEGHPRVERVLYPGLPSHPQHDLFRRQMRGGSGMVSFFLRGDLEATRRCLESLRLFQIAESLGAVESTVNHPAIMTHASVPAAARRQLGITDNLVRLSVGIEDPEDLIADLEQALRAAVPVQA
jgi:cystathionine gamma-lyase